MWSRESLPSPQPWSLSLESSCRSSPWPWEEDGACAGPRACGGPGGSSGRWLFPRRPERGSQPGFPGIVPPRCCGNGWLYLHSASRAVNYICVINHACVVAGLRPSHRWQLARPLNRSKLLFPSTVCPLAAAARWFAVFVCREVTDFRSSRGGHGTALVHALCESGTSGHCSRMSRCKAAHMLGLE